MSYRRAIIRSRSSYLRPSHPDRRLRLAAVLIGLAAALIIARLFTLMVLQRDFYTALAAGSQETYAKLFPRRGEIFLQDARSGEEFPVAINQDVFLMFADTRAIPDDATAQKILATLTPIFNYDGARTSTLFAALNKRTDPYEPLEQKVEPAVKETIAALALPGINFIRRPHRFYPEHNLAAHALGFLGKKEDGSDAGRYGIEGYWQKELAGEGGWLEGAQSAKGRWIALAKREFKPAKDGADLVLTIDRTIQYRACEALRRGLTEYKATSAALVILDPKTGAVLALCSLPDFDPNVYGQAADGSVYNNQAIFTPYEPGSIFKPLTMAAALNEEAVKPDTPFRDTGSRSGLCSHPIQNAGNKVHGDQTMTGVLQNSINTGMVYVVEKLGKERFVEYVKKFGFGVKTGLELDTEVTGVVDSLYKNKNNKLDCYTATASFGQGITVTPMQIASAFGALANGGRLMKPYIVKEQRFANGRVERTKPRELGLVVGERAAGLLGGMLVKTVDKGYSGRARVSGYYVAGKSGTAEIAGPGGYTETYNHSFVGFAPADNPRFVMLVKYEKPQRAYAESTAAPVFGELAKFLLDYFQVPPARPVGSE